MTAPTPIPIVIATKGRGEPKGPSLL